LTAQGIAEGRGLGKLLAGHSFSDVLSSPRSRALETCRLAGFDDRVQVDDDLAEWDYGSDEGRTTAEIQRDRTDWSIWHDGPLGGETIDEVAARADRVVERIRAATGDVLVFAHGHLLRILAACWLGQPPQDGRLLLLEPATISILGWERETAVIERWNAPC
jgi:probable phosphoglycerate mutase